MYSCMYDWIHERIDQSSHFFPTGSKKETVVHTRLQHPTVVLLSHVYHIYTQQLFNFQKIFF